MHKYKIQSMQAMAEGYCLIKISLGPSDEGVLVFKLIEESIDDLQKTLLENNRLILDKLVKVALLDNTIIKQLQDQKNGVFEVDYDLWISTIYAAKEEQDKMRLKRLSDSINSIVQS